MVARAAQLGEMGDVDAALECTQQAESIGRQHETLHKQLTEPDRTMTVCEICGVFINSTDNEQRRLVSTQCRAYGQHVCCYGETVPAGKQQMTASKRCLPGGASVKGCNPARLLRCLLLHFWTCGCTW